MFWHTHSCAGGDLLLTSLLQTDHNVHINLQAKIAGLDVGMQIVIPNPYLTGSPLDSEKSSTMPEGPTA